MTQRSGFNPQSGRCRIIAWWARSGAVVRSSDGENEFGEGVEDPMPRIDVGDQFAMTAVEISDEGVSRADYSRRAQPFEPAHGPQSGFQAAVRCTVRTFTGRCRARYVVPHACHKRGSATVNGGHS